MNGILYTLMSLVIVFILLWSYCLTIDNKTILIKPMVLSSLLPINIVNSASF